MHSTIMQALLHVDPNVDSDIFDIGWNGQFHEDIKKDLAEYFREHGLIVQTEVNFILVGSPIIARADIVVMMPGDPSSLVVIDVKTGPGSALEPNQQWVYPSLVHGLIVTSPDAKIKSFGYLPGQVLPPIPVVIWYERYPWTPMHQKLVPPEIPFEWSAPLFENLYPWDDNLGAHND